MLNPSTLLFENASDPSLSTPVSAANPLPILTREFLVNVGFNLAASAGYTRVTALGNNPDIDILSVPEDVWTGGGVYPWMTASTALEILSNSANDAAAGTGARTVLINGLDANYVPVVQTITLNGVTPVALTSNLFRINSAFIMSAGTGKINAGDITIRDSGGGTTRAILPLGYGITRQSMYTVPAGSTLQILSQFLGFNSVTKDARFAKISNFIQSASGFYRMPLEFAISDQAPYRHDGAPGITLAEKTDFCHRITAVSDDNSNFTSAWLGVQRLNTAS